MTWVIGMARHLIGGLLVGDIRVSFQNGRSADLIQKVHEVAPNVAVGFSGSVSFGFAMVDDLRSFAGATYPAGCLPTNVLVQEWHHRASNAWSSASAAQRANGCSLLIVGAKPRRGIVNSNVGFYLRAPDFSPTE